MVLANYRYKDLIHRCFRCGYCKFPENWIDLNNCPPYARFRLESYSTGGRLWLIRAWLNGEIELTDRLASIVYSCTTCKNCVSQCPFNFNVDIVNMIVAARGEMIELGLIPPKVQEFLENVERQGNPYGIARAQRGEWLEGTKIEKYEGHEFLYYVGCVGSYDDRAKVVARALGRLLGKAGVSFGVLGSEESCDGNEVLSLGEEGLFQVLAEENIESFRNLGVSKIVTLSPHSYNAIINNYPDVDGAFEVLHYTQLLRNLIADNRLRMARPVDATVTYHDPCFLGRYNDEYDAPRQVLESIPGIKLVDMERNRKGALCCGGGSGNFYTDFLSGSKDSPARIRVREACNTGANILAVACPKCLVMLEDAVKAEGLEDRLEVKDISEIALGACQAAGD